MGKCPQIAAPSIKINIVAINSLSPLKFCKLWFCLLSALHNR